MTQVAQFRRLDPGLVTSAAGACRRVAGLVDECGTWEIPPTILTRELERLRFLLADLRETVEHYEAMIAAELEGKAGVLRRVAS